MAPILQACILFNAKTWAASRCCWSSWTALNLISCTGAGLILGGLGNLGAKVPLSFVFSFALFAVSLGLDLCSCFSLSCLFLLSSGFVTVGWVLDFAVACISPVSRATPLFWGPWLSIPAISSLLGRFTIIAMTTSARRVGDNPASQFIHVVDHAFWW